MAANLEFLNAECGEDQVRIGPAGSGLCANCPSAYEDLDLEEVQALAEEEAKEQAPAVRLLPANSNKPYSGNNAIVLKWTLYGMKYGSDPDHEHFGFRNPFFYPRIATPFEALQIGKNVGIFSGGGRRPSVSAAAVAPAVPAAGRARPAVSGPAAAVLQRRRGRSASPAAARRR